jgi:type III secretory pathway component EscU
MLYMLLSALDILDRLLALKVRGRLLADDTRERPPVLLVLETVLSVLPNSLSKQVLKMLVGVSRLELFSGVVTLGVVFAVDGG